MKKSSYKDLEDLENFVPLSKFNDTIKLTKIIITSLCYTTFDFINIKSVEDLYKIINKNKYLLKNLKTFKTEFSKLPYIYDMEQKFIDILTDMVISHIPFEEGRTVYDIFDIFNSKILESELINLVSLDENDNVLLDLKYFNKNSEESDSDFENLESFKVNRSQFYITSQLLYQYVNSDVEFDFYNDSFIFKDSDTNKNFVLNDLNKPSKYSKYVLIIYSEPLKQKGIEYPNSDIQKFPININETVGTKYYFSDANDIISSVILPFKILMREREDIFFEDIGAYYGIFDRNDNSQVFIKYRDSEQI